MSSWNANWSRWSVTMSRVVVMRSSVLGRVDASGGRVEWNSESDYRD
jgi:hypothetical protein